MAAKLTAEQERQIQEAYEVYESQLLRISQDSQKAIDFQKQSLKSILAKIRGSSFPANPRKVRSYGVTGEN